MQPTLNCFGVGLVLFSLAPSTMTFSRGASHASCQEMIPGHIRAQPQNLQHNHVTLRASASSYLPGQLVSVTVRSSRDFMGFLLQARSVEGAGGRAGVGFKARKGVGAGVRSTRVGPVLVGGSWTLIPPGTHTLRCLSEGDTLTHTDKQPKRNLSFVWRAPDVPMGDIRFYITVVQSYFVYWAGISSAVVRDGSHSHWSGSNITGVDERNSISAPQEDEVAALQALRTVTSSNKQTNETASPATTLRPPTPTINGTDRHTKSPLTEVTRPAMEINSSVTLATLRLSWNESNSSVTLGSLRNATKGGENDTYATSGFLSGVTEEAGAVHTEDPKSSLFSSSHLRFTDSFSSAEAKGMDSTTSLLPNITVQNTTSILSLLHSLASLPPLKDVGMERKDAKRNFHDPKLPTIPETKDTALNPQTSTMVKPLTSHSFHNLNFPRPISQNPKGPIQDQTSPVKFKTHSSPSQPWRNSLTTSKMSLIKDEMDSQTLIQPLNPHLKASVHSQTGTSQSFPESHTTSSLIQAHLQSQAKIKTMSPIFVSIPSAIPPTFSTPHSSSFSSTHTLPASSPVHSSSTTHRTESSTLVSIQTASTHASISSSPSSLKNQSTTAPALSALPSPSPISIPPYIPSVQPSTFYPMPSYVTSSTKPSLNSSHNPSSVPLSTSSSSPFISSQSITSSTFSSPSPSTLASSTIASSASSISSAPSFHSSSHFLSPVSTSTSTSSLGSSSFSNSSSISSLVSSQSTTPHPEPSPAPRRSLFNPLTSTASPVPSQQLTLGQRLQIQSHIASYDPEPNLNPPTPRSMVHPNPKPNPNHDPDFKLNTGHELKPHPPNTDTKPKTKHPSGKPDREGKYPDITPRHSAWELGMLLGCSATLGMVLVIGIRYMYRQACAKRTELTLNDREREYGRGERGLIHVQECGDLVRVRKIRENSFVLLAEYDILAPPGD